MAVAPVPAGLKGASEIRKGEGRHLRRYAKLHGRSIKRRHGTLILLTHVESTSLCQRGQRLVIHRSPGSSFRKGFLQNMYSRSTDAVWVSPCASSVSR